MATEPIGLAKLNMETLEAFFPSERPTPREDAEKIAGAIQKPEDEFEIRRKLFFEK